ncbi:nuclease-related domain-containing protein [Neobacillus sp. FSL H8-0543]|uniref:nuclease-related domain-containing protein n=1 Tax=Neobacillus sp. FSL H8-0543 TaxID=2954672 RepID=UPI003159318C
MITAKDRDDSLSLQGLIATQSRLSVQHAIAPILATKQAAVEAGIGGEERVAEVLRSYTFPIKNTIFHDLSLSSDSTFQMDHFFKTPYYGVILETKNISGSLNFKENPPQLVQTKENGVVHSYESLVVQLERNLELLTAWLKSRNIHLPLYGAVVLAYPKQIVEFPPSKTTILFPNMIPPYIKNLPRHGKKLELDAFNRLSAELLKCHRIYIPKPISETYQIPFNELQSGVRCVTCGTIGMIKVPRTWHCPGCKANNHLAHIPALREWFLVFKRTITNSECGEFMGGDIDTAKRILQSMELDSKGAFRYQSYTMDFRKKGNPIKNK